MVIGGGIHISLIGYTNGTNMTLDEYKDMLNSQRVVIGERLQCAKEQQRAASIEHDLKALQDACVAVQIFDAKLDMLDHFLSMVNKVEIPKTKMREFL